MPDPFPSGRPPHSRRDRVLEILRSDGFVSYRELAELGIPMPRAHIESLEGEGHVIETDLTARDERGRPNRGWRLIRDVWLPDSDEVAA